MFSLNSEQVLQTKQVVKTLLLFLFQVLVWEAGRGLHRLHLPGSDDPGPGGKNWFCPMLPADVISLHYVDRTSGGRDEPETAAHPSS